MCLDFLGKYKLGRKRTGWKVFGGFDALYGQFFSEGKKRPEGKWLDEKDFREDKRWRTLETSRDERYPIGFHVFLRKPCPEARKVRFRGVLAKGYQEVGLEGRAVRTIVVKKIFIIPAPAEDC